MNYIYVVVKGAAPHLTPALGAVPLNPLLFLKGCAKWTPVCLSACEKYIIICGRTRTTAQWEGGLIGRKIALVNDSGVGGGTLK